MKGFLKILRYVIKHKKYIALNLTSNVLNVFFSFFSMTLIAPFVGILFGLIDPVTENPGLHFDVNSVLNWTYYHITLLQTEYGNMYAVAFIAILFIVFTFIAVSLRYAAASFLVPVRNGVLRDIRADLNKQLLSMPLTFFHDKQKGDVLARFTSDSNEVEASVVKFLQSIVKDPIIIIVFVITLFMISPLLMSIAIVVVPIIAWLVSIISGSLKRNSQRLQKEYGTMMSVVEESVTALKVIKSYNMQDKSIADFNKNQQRFTHFQNKIQRRVTLSSPLSEVLVAISAISVIWFGGSLVISEEIKPEIFVLFVVLFFRLISPVKDFASAFFSLQKGKAAMKRIWTILDADIETNDAKQSSEEQVALNSFENNIKFENVGFFYENTGKKYVLKNFNTEIKKGEKVAIVGRSGTGKTTLIDLLCRFYECTEGHIYIDDIDIRKIKIEDLRSRIGLVSQYSFLFNDTILENLTLGEEYDINAVIEAAKKANAYNFIMDMGGFQASLSDAGTNLSGGQRQRLNIARVILKNPDILILDEATAALDNKTEAEVQQALDTLMKDKTTIIISHRQSAIINTNKTITLEA